MKKIRTQTQIRPWRMTYRKPVHILRNLENELNENKSPLYDFPLQRSWYLQIISVLGTRWHCFSESWVILSDLVLLPMDMHFLFMSDFVIEDLKVVSRFGLSLFDQQINKYNRSFK